MPCPFEADTIYMQRLTRHLLRLISRGPLSFSELVRLGGGAYPTEVHKVLHSLITGGEVNAINGVYFLCEPMERRLVDIKISEQELAGLAKTDPARVVSRSASPTFADPHPADYDWRYTSASLAELSRRLGPLIEDGVKIALFGCPTLFPRLVKAGAQVVLFDRSQSLLADLQAMGLKEGLIGHDLFDPIRDASRDYAVVVADPPWYPDFYRAFILRSTELLRDEGLLLLSVLPWLTRPSAIEDRAEMLGFAAQAGFDLVEVAPNALTYESPKFERIALAKQGLDCIDWRAGDLFVFHRVNKPIPGIAAARPKDEQEWDEYRLGRRRVKLRRRSEADGARFVLRLVAEDSPIFGEVSRRAPSRGLIDLWTSDNVAYSVDGLELLRHALKRLEGGESPSSIGEDFTSQYSLSVDEIRALVNLLRELKEESDS